MARFDFNEKEVFVEQCRLKNLARFLLCIVQKVYAVINSPKLMSVASDGWRGLPSSSQQQGDQALIKENPALDSQTDSSMARIIERTDLRFCFWQIVRHCRELVLKALVLINVLEKSKFYLIMNHALEMVSKLLDMRGMLRKCGFQFGSVQWPPRGWGEPPFPPYAVDVAIDVLLGRESYPRLPKLLEEVVKQVGEAEPAAGMRLEDDVRESLERRISIEVRSMWALSQCEKSQVLFKLEKGIISFSVPNEFRIRAIYDMHRLQIIEAEILAGTTSYGLDIPPIFNVGFRNFFCHCIGLLEDRYYMGLEELKRHIRTLSITKSNQLAARETTLNGPPDDILSTQVKYLEDCFFSMLCFEDGLVRKYKKRKKTFHDTTASLLHNRLTPLHEQQRTPYNADLCDSTPPQSDTTAMCERLKDTTVDYFAECLRIGRWVSGGIILAVLRDQALRARNFSAVYPGCVFRCTERQPKDFQCLDADKIYGHDAECFRALDLCIVPSFDFSCGSLWTPLLVLLFESPALRRIADEEDHLWSMLSMDPKSGPCLVELSTGTSTAVAHWEFRGSGGILRIGFNVITGYWGVYLWPISPLLSLLESLNDIERRTSVDATPQKLTDVARALLPFDLDYIYRTLKNDLSWKFLQTFNAGYLELTAWTHHASAVLATLSLVTLLSYLKNSGSPTVFTPDVELCNDSISQSNSLTSLHFLKWVYFKRYSVTLRVNCFEGSLRISFAFLKKHTESWVRLERISLEAQLAAAVATGTSGMSGLLRLLPYLKYMAFLHLLESVVKSRNWEDSPSLRLLVDKELADDVENDSTTQPGLTSMSLGQHWYPMSCGPTGSTVENRVTVALTSDTVQLTQVFHILRKVFYINAKGELCTSLVFIHTRLEDIVLCIYVDTAAASRIHKTDLLIIRSSLSHVAARFNLAVKPVVLDEKSVNDVESLEQSLHRFVEHVDSIIQGMDVELCHATTLAQLVPKTLPLNILNIAVEADDPKSVQFWSSVLPYHGDSLRRDLGWTGEYFNTSLGVPPPLVLQIKYTFNTCVSVTLSTSSGARLPAFQGDHLDQRPSVQFGSYSCVVWGKLERLLPDLWYTRILTLQVQQSSPSVPLVSLYKEMADQLSVLGFFLRGCREVHRLQLLRNDVNVLVAHPAKLAVLWTPWAICTPSWEPVLTRSYTLSMHVELPPVYFVWQVCPCDPPDSNGAVTIKVDRIRLTIANCVLQPVLAASTQTLEAFLRKTHSISPWMVMRYVILSFELHASISLLVDHTQSQICEELGFPAPCKETLLQSGYRCWSREEHCALGTEKLVLNVEKMAHHFPGTLGRLVDKITLHFSTTLSNRQQCHPCAPLGTPLCISFYATITPITGVNSSLDHLGESLNTTLAQLAATFGSCFQETVMTCFTDTLVPACVTPLPLTSSGLPRSTDALDPSLLWTTQTYSLYITPTRLLMSLIVPLVDAVVLWLNGVMAASMMSSRVHAARSGTFRQDSVYQSSGTKSASGSTRVSKASRGAIVLGAVQWDYPTGDGASDSAPCTVTDLLPFPDDKRTVCTSQMMESTGASCFGFERPPQDVAIAHHVLEFQLIPSLRTPLQFSPVLKYQHPPNSSFLSLQPSLFCGSASLSTSVLFETLSFLYWESVRLLYRKYAYSRIKPNSRVYSQHCADWPHEFNANLLPLAPFEELLNDSEVTPLVPSFLVFHEWLLRCWQRNHNERDSSTSTPESSSQLENLIVLHYWDLCPDALVLPYEVSHHPHEQLPWAKAYMNQESRKRRRPSMTPASYPKRLCRDPLSLDVVESQSIVCDNAPSDATPANSGTASQSGILESLGHHENRTDSDGVAASSERPFEFFDHLRHMCNNHASLLLFVKKAVWIPPLKPRTALQADNVEVEVAFHCSLEWRVMPSTTEWSVVTEYSKMFAHELFWGNLTLLLNMLQKTGPGPLLSDMISIMELSTHCAQTYLGNLKLGAAQWRSSTDADYARSDDDCPLMRNIPFVMFFLTHPAEHRHSGQPVLVHLPIVVCNAIPFLAPYLGSMLQLRTGSKTNTNSKYVSGVYDAIRTASFGFILSIPLGTQETPHVVINKKIDLDTLLERLCTAAYNGGLTCSAAPISPLSLHRPLSLRLVRLFFSSFPYSIMESVFEALKVS